MQGDASTNLPGDLDLYAQINQFVLTLTKGESDPYQTWDRVKGTARAHWEAEHPGTWDQVKDAIYQAWRQSKHPLP